MGRTTRWCRLKRMPSCTRRACPTPSWSRSKAVSMWRFSLTGLWSERKRMSSCNATSRPSRVTIGSPTWRPRANELVHRSFIKVAQNISYPKNRRPGESDRRECRNRDPVGAPKPWLCIPLRSDSGLRRNDGVHFNHLRTIPMTFTQSPCPAASGDGL